LFDPSECLDVVAVRCGAPASLFAVAVRLVPSTAPVTGVLDNVDAVAGPDAVAAGVDAVVPPSVADGAVVTDPDWIVPAEFDALLPPPICTVPTDPVAVLPPDPEPTDVGTETDAGPTGVVALSAGPAVIGPDWTVNAEPEAVLPPPICAEPIESVVELVPLLPTVTGAVAVALPNGSEAAMSAAIIAAPASTASNDRVVSLPPPSCTAPIESVALFPLPAIPAVRPTPIVEPATVAPAAGLVCVAPACTAPTEPLAEFPPPTCTAPMEFDALFPPLPPTLVGALT